MTTADTLKAYQAVYIICDYAHLPLPDSIRSVSDGYVCSWTSKMFIELCYNSDNRPWSVLSDSERTSVLAHANQWLENIIGQKLNIKATISQKMPSQLRINTLASDPNYFDVSVARPYKVIYMDPPKVEMPRNLKTVVSALHFPVPTEVHDTIGKAYVAPRWNGKSFCEMLIPTYDQMDEAERIELTANNGPMDGLARRVINNVCRLTNIDCIYGTHGDILVKKV